MFLFFDVVLDCKMRPSATDVAHVAWSVCLCVCLYVCLCVGQTDVLCKNGWTDRDAVWGLNLLGPRKKLLDGVKIGRIHWQPRGMTSPRFGHLFICICAGTCWTPSCTGWRYLWSTTGWRWAQESWPVTDTSTFSSVEWPRFQHTCFLSSCYRSKPISLVVRYWGFGADSLLCVQGTRSVNIGRIHSQRRGMSTYLSTHADRQRVDK